MATRELSNFGQAVTEIYGMFGENDWRRHAAMAYLWQRLAYRSQQRADFLQGREERRGEL